MDEKVSERPAVEVSKMVFSVDGHVSNVQCMMSNVHNVNMYIYIYSWHENGHRIGVQWGYNWNIVGSDPFCCPNFPLWFVLGR